MAHEGYGVLRVERVRPAQHRRPGRTAHLDCETAYPVRKEAEAINHEIHHHRVIGVLGATETCFDDRKAGLHEHHKEAAHQRPCEVDPDTILPNLIDDISQGQSLL